MSAPRPSLGHSVGSNKVGLIWDGNVSLLASLYKDTPTKRRFRFYGIAIGWVMIGVTVASTHSLARGPADATLLPRYVRKRQVMGFPASWEVSDDGKDFRTATDAEAEVLRGLPTVLE